MSQLNRNAAEALRPLDTAIHSVTDITGFGFIGHALEMANASCASMRIESNKIKLIDGAMECVKNGFIAGGLKKNRDYVGTCAAFGNVSEEIQNLLFDPQTSGGLLISIQPELSARACSLLKAAGCFAMQVGQVIPKSSPIIDIF